MKKKTLFLILATIILVTIFQPVRASQNEDSTIKVVGFVSLSTDQTELNHLSLSDLSNIKEELKRFAERENYAFFDSASINEKIIFEAIKNPFSVIKLLDIKPDRRKENITLTKGIFIKSYLALRYNPNRNFLEIILVERNSIEKTCIPIILLIALTLTIFKAIFSILADRPKGYGHKRLSKRNNRNMAILAITSIILLLLFIRLAIYSFSYKSEMMNTGIILIFSLLGIVDNLTVFKNKWTATLITIVIIIGLFYTFFFL